MELLVWFELHHSVHVLLAWMSDNSLSLSLDFHVWLTQSAATLMEAGVFTPPLKGPAVSSYIIAEPCLARWMALSACH